MALETELEYFAKMKAELLRNHEGKFVLIHGNELCGSFDSAESAYNAGVEKFGLEPILVKKVTQVEEVYKNLALSLGLMNARL